MAPARPPQALQQEPQGDPLEATGWTAGQLAYALIGWAYLIDQMS